MTITIIVYLQHDYQISVHSLTRHVMHQSLLFIRLDDGSWTCNMCSCSDFVLQLSRFVLARLILSNHSCYR